jgi:NAD(P)H-hydrate epimerase
MNEILTVEEMARADQATITAGTRGIVLMERAGRAVADCAQDMVQPGASILVLCGPGNNGGDGFVAARCLAGRGYAVSLALFGSPEALTGDAALAAEGWAGPVLSLADTALGGVSLVIDALFGAGLNRPIEGIARDMLGKISASGIPVLAVDVPSGLEGNTGQVLGFALGATRTVTFARLKPAHGLYPGRRLCGKVTVAEIGISDETIASLSPKLHVNGPDLWRGIPARPEEEGHKFRRGHLLVVSGGVESTGAARLAAQAGARTGAGLVTVASPSDALTVNAAALTDIMVRQSNGVEGLEALLIDQRRNAVVLGPGAGIGSTTRGQVKLVLESGRAAVLDADALTSFEGDAVALAAYVKQSGAGQTVITPHDGEFSRLFNQQLGILEAKDRLFRARKAAAFLGLVVVFKGPDTVIAAPDGRAALSMNGTPWLATAGSGDVLAGAIGGLLAQGHQSFEAAAAGVWLHAEAGRSIGPGLMAHDLPVALRSVIGRLLA